MYLDLLKLIHFSIILIIPVVQCQFNDICGAQNGKRFYLEHGETGSLLADYRNNDFNKQSRNNSYEKCTVEFITCPSCIFEINFRFLNISRNCGKDSVFDSCGCDYLWINEPPTDDGSGEQFCGRFLKDNVSDLTYNSQTRTVAFTFVYSNEYGHAFTLDYFTKRNRIFLTGQPKTGNMNNASQFISSPFFPYLYPIDLSVEYLINCESQEPCRISLIFTDFLVADSSIIEFFDWNGQRMYVTSGSIFRPPVIISSGPTLVIRFYANGASNLGFKASYLFILGNLNDMAFKPNIGCGGYVNNLGGGITMMNMVNDGTMFFDCVWLIKPPENSLHRKTHLYVKVIDFTNFAGTTELTIRQGLTSNQPSVEVLRHPMTHFSIFRQMEHVVPITQGFYISLRGLFRPESRLTIVFAAFNYKDCFGGSDFLCHNLRCISALLNCDGFDHCGDNSDESSTCSQDPKDHRGISKIPNFLFPKIQTYSDITTATFVFLSCSLGLIGIILAMALLLYRVNMRARHQRQIQDHIETIHAILEESVGDVEEEIIVPDEPPDYEAPPDYEDVLKMKFNKNFGTIKLSTKNIRKTIDVLTTTGDANFVESSASCSGKSQTKVPASPPPAYDYVKDYILEINGLQSGEILSNSETVENAVPGPSRVTFETIQSETIHFKNEVLEDKSVRCFENFPKYSSQIFSDIRKSFRNCKTINFIKHARKIMSFSDENLTRYFSDSELSFNTNCNKNCWTRSNRSKLRRSFSTDDISLL